MNLLINGTKNTPKIIFNSSLNEWEISGRSYPNDVNIFYYEMLEWISNFEDKSVGHCTIIFKLEFFNTNSSKIFLEILMRLREKMDRQGCNLIIKWYYEFEDEDMKENGESFMEISKMEFDFIPY